MAKRYFNFEKLEGFIKEGKNIIKPAGTLGRHHLQIKQSGRYIKARGIERNKNYDPDLAQYVINYDEEEFFSLSKWVTVKPGGTLGYNRGSVWAIKPKSEMTLLQLLRAEFFIPKENVIILPREEFKNIEIEELESAVSEDNIHANRNRFWGHGETVPFVGEYSMFTEYHSFHGGTDQRRRLYKVYLEKEHLDEAIKEVFEAIAKYKGKRFTNIKHPANNLMFAP